MGHFTQPTREKWPTIAVKVLISGTSGVSQAALLIDVVKRTLRHKGLTYRYVARGLKLSESSVKRMFARRNLSLGRLEQICALMHLEIADLLDLTRTADGSVTQLSEKQERELVGNPKLLLVGMLTLSHWTAAKILETYRFSESELVGLLTRLDRMRIIDLLPENRIKLRLARNFNWRKGGAIQRFFEERVQRQFFEASFLRAGELRVTVHGSLSEKSNGVLQRGPTPTITPLKSRFAESVGLPAMRLWDTRLSPARPRPTTHSNSSEEAPPEKR